MKLYRIISLCILLSTYVLTGYSQKVDLDKLKVKLQYLTPPLNNDLEQFNSYSVNFDADQKTLDQLSIKPDMIGELFKLDGFVYLPDLGDVIYSINIGKPVVLKEEVVKREDKVQNPDGTSKMVAVYHAHYYLSVPTVIQILSNITGEPLYVDVISTLNEPTKYVSDGQATLEKAQAILNMKDGAMNVNGRSEYRKDLTNAVTKLKRKNDYQKGIYSEEFFDIDVKKAPELTKLHEEIMLVTETLINAPIDQPLFVRQTKLEPILAKWKAEDAKLNSADKNNKKLKFMYLYNLAITQLWLEYFNDALETCKQIKENDYHSHIATDIENRVGAIKKELSESGFTSRFIIRQGFFSKTSYTYTPEAKKKFDFVDQAIKKNKADFEEIKKSGKEFTKGLKDDFGKKVLGDTIDAMNSMFSSAIVTLDGKVNELKEKTLSTGYGRPCSKAFDELYQITCWKGDKYFDYLTEKEGELKGVELDFYSNTYTKENIKAGTILDFLKGLQGSELTDISTTSRYDTVPFFENDEKKKPKEISWKEYGKEISMEIELTFKTKSFNDIYSFRTMNGDKFHVKIVESRPIVVKGNGGICTQGYGVRILIPEVRMARLYYGHYRPCYRDTYKVVKNLELFVILQ